MSTTTSTKPDSKPDTKAEAVEIEIDLEPNTLCGCQQIRITPHIFVDGLCTEGDDEEEGDPSEDE